MQRDTKHVNTLLLYSYSSSSVMTLPCTFLVRQTPESISHNVFVKFQNIITLKCFQTVEFRTLKLCRCFHTHKYVLISMFLDPPLFIFTFKKISPMFSFSFNYLFFSIMLTHFPRLSYCWFHSFLSFSLL